MKAAFGELPAEAGGNKGARKLTASKKKGTDEETAKK
jgi:hypothetical protein